MNIFYLDVDIQKCVEYHCDKHVVKMCIEYAQLLSSVHHMVGADSTCMYKLTHKNHPCAVWARSSQQNYEYLFSLAVLLGEEYTHRYRKRHKSMDIVEAAQSLDLPSLGFTDPPKCIPDDLKEIPDVVEAYRTYYKRDKAHFCKWTNRPIPDWFS
jgi:hypothetical protein